jgi:hypothetical protein
VDRHGKYLIRAVAHGVRLPSSFTPSKNGAIIPTIPIRYKLGVLLLQFLSLCNRGRRGIAFLTSDNDVCYVWTLCAKTRTIIQRQIYCMEHVLAEIYQIIMVIESTVYSLFINTMNDESVKL